MDVAGIVLGVVALFALGLLALETRAARIERETDRRDAALERARWLEAHERLTEATVSRALMLKGLHPHYAAPQTFTEAGMSRDRYEALQRQQTEEVASERKEGENPDEDLAEWMGVLQDQAKNRHITTEEPV